MSIILSGDNGVTFPNSTVQASAGSVLQVVQGVFNATNSTTNTSYTASGITASITPKFSTSKILVTTSSLVLNSVAGSNTYLTVYRNSTNLGGGTYSALSAVIPNAGTTSLWQPCNMVYLDSPATTSSTTYTIYFYATANTAYASINQNTSTITLMEIAA